uniref:Tektin n=1 Tax=Timema genevievae TaxID=629358 RepID=A0A7R9JZ33_TIMGE|nr:unnamed protein product [Timema genevievae]
MSIVTYEKPVRPTSLPDWHSRTWELRQTANTRRGDAFELRHEGRQLRNETNIKTKWDTYHNDTRLADRVVEMSRWKEVLQQCLTAVEGEIAKLADEKAQTERELENLNEAFNVLAECMTLRDGRQGADLVQDQAYMELKNELEVLEALKKSLTTKSQASWEQLNRLKEIEFKLQLDIGNKVDAINIDRENLEMDKNCSGTSFKPDPLRIPKNCIPYEAWMEHSRFNKLKADNEITASSKLRETLFVTRERTNNDLKAQHNATDYAFRRRIYETQRARNELEWQRKKLLDEMSKLMKETEDLQKALDNKTDALKLAETRLENRMFRPGPELVEDEGQISLKDEVLHLRQTRQDLADKIASAKGTYNTLENLLVCLDADLANKEHALMTDLRCVDVRKKLKGGAAQASPATQTDRNIQLTRMEEEIPPS